MFTSFGTLSKRAFRCYKTYDQAYRCRKCRPPHQGGTCYNELDDTNFPDGIKALVRKGDVGLEANKKTKGLKLLFVKTYYYSMSNTRNTTPCRCRIRLMNLVIYILSY